jgi:DNA polymerase-3 subunit gamma/tau
LPEELPVTYRVLARTYRSNTFDEVVGQDVAATTLKNAIQSGRIHHGYLFTGTRGVGKTSMARILAKSLNCLSAEGPTVSPCLSCDSCRAIASGEDIDVVEIDAASNTGVDNIRDLRTNANLRPARARFKIYIIDEVHMLSTGAFNALLKTLEEPPPHVKFILATTEIHKVPATIQSRCQRFDFRAIDAASIAGHLRRILEAEKIEADDPVLKRVARLANGSMRDALSLLDMLLSYEPKRLTGEIVNELIPPPHDELAFAVLEAVARRDAAGALAALDRALQTGRTVERFCDHLVDHARTLMLMRVCGDETDLVDVSETMRPQLSEQAKQFDAPTYVFIINLLEELRRSVKFSGAARALADAAVVRLALSRQFTDLDELIERLDEDEPAIPPVAASSAEKKNVANSAKLDGAERERADFQPCADLTGKPPRTTPVVNANVNSPYVTRPAVMTYDSVQTPLSRSGAAGSVDWDRARRDPLIQRLQEAVEGTIKDVWRVNRAPTGPSDLEEEASPAMDSQEADANLVDDSASPVDDR